jgi:hypothetical protein
MLVGMEVAVGPSTWAGSTVDMEAAVGEFPCSDATVAGRGELGAVIWPDVGAQPENTPLNMVTTRVVVKW